ncbi:uncharacterized protein LOC114761540 [Neltuma alba]|uniref:uncharacterized protein LOC114761540 n=1 Tax=Neltuma alba TaxID=207710 RepID=UPI0010A33828|nr:uncharacterized protein LOC114761540 [Prosopis alba]
MRLSRAEEEILRKDPAAEGSKVGTSSLDLIETQAHVELEKPLVVKDSKDAQEKYKAPLPLHPTMLSPSIEASTSSAISDQHPSEEDLVDFHGLFKIEARRALLLKEAFVKYPQLLEWKISQKDPMTCKLGYETLANMLEFLKSDIPKTMMDESKRKQFEYLCDLLEHFGFDKDWVASIRHK